MQRDHLVVVVRHGVYTAAVCFDWSGSYHCHQNLFPLVGQLRDQKSHACMNFDPACVLVHGIITFRDVPLSIIPSFVTTTVLGTLDGRSYISVGPT